MIRASALIFTVLLAARPASAQTAAQSADPYFANGRTTLEAALARRPNTGRARNVIIFVGDGMGISTVTAGRIFEGQSRGADGESNALAFERLPYVALSKTYSTDTQVADSAATATAIMSGVKTRNRLVGVGPGTKPFDCESSRADSLSTIAELARAKGKAAGFVTTTRVTHATPAATYAHAAFRDWEGDSNMPPAARQAGCSDIAQQLVEAPANVRLNVAMGGGLSRFTPKTAGGAREDGRDLTREWQAAPRSTFVSNAAGLSTLRPGRVDHVLGLFAPEHLPYEADRQPNGPVPSLADMTAKAIDLLSADRDGYFLLVEGGKIDMAHHQNNAARALGDTAALSEAVKVALAKIDLKNTLVLVTADHSHGLVVNGYAPRNAPIAGIAGNEGAPIKAGDGKAYTTLTYATGPGGPKGNATRHDPAESDLDDEDYVQSATVHLPSSAHSGEDVAIFAGGPQAHLLEGVVEQSYIFHVMRHAMGL